MLQLSEAQKRNFIGGVYPGELKQILRAQHPSVTVQNIAAGIIIFSDSNMRSLKCVSNYYEKDSPLSNVKGKDNYLVCRTVRTALGIEREVPNAQCVLCHLTCMRLQEAGTIRTQKKKRGKN